MTANQFTLSKRICMASDGTTFPVWVKVKRKNNENEKEKK